MATRIAAELPDRLHDLHTGVALYHPETGRVLDANGSFRRIVGYPLDRLREMTVEAYSANTFSLSEREILAWMRAAADGDVQKFRWHIKRGDGELVWVDVSLSPIAVGPGRYVLAEATDVTESVHDNRRVRLFTRIIRHNLRNDTNVISGYAEEIQSLPTDEAITEYADRIHRKALDIGRISASVGQIEAAVTGTAAEKSRKRARTVAETVLRQYRRQHPDVEFALDERTELWVRTDEALRYALEQAVDNAVVHNDADDPRVGVRIDESPNTGRLEIRIADNGPPIPEMELTALDDATDATDTSHGSGVGLFVMKWCVESLGGELHVQRRDGRGNAVYFLLPPRDPPEV